jgi:HEPN domain-containing protein
MQGEGVYLEDLCFNTQQAVEKAIKALLIQRHVQFPYVHDIAELLTVLEEAGQELPQAIRQAERLTRFAVFTRYPGIARRSAWRSIRRLYTYPEKSSDGWSICYSTLRSRNWMLRSKNASL